MSTVVTDPQAIGAGDRELEPGTEVGEYKVEAVLGKGGFGTVYRAVHPLIGKQVAIKVLSRKYSADPAVVSRFVAEARSVNQIRHRNIIDIFSFGQLADGRHYYVMEHLDGEPLDQVVARTGPLALAEALPILRALARALDAAHAKGIAHRDLKPENIFLAQESDGTKYPKLLDFGIAKLLAPDDNARHRTGTGVPLGTPYYMSPEQCRGRDVDHRTDIYSFGIVTYRLLTGAYPFDGDDYMDLLVKQVNAEPVPPSVRNPLLPATVDAAVAWMMRKDRADRPQTVMAGISALDPLAPVTPAIPRLRSNRRTASPSIAPPAAAQVTDPLAATTATTPAPLRPKSRSTLWIRGALVVVPVAVMISLYVQTRHGTGPANRSELKLVPDHQAAAADLPVASQPSNIGASSVADAGVPDHVFITIADAPPSAEVAIGGTRIGYAPMVQVPYGDQPVLLTITADSYLPVTESVIPDRAREITVRLRKRPVAPRAHNRDDLPGFPK